jgi:hypothetical protein
MHETWDRRIEGDGCVQWAKPVSIPYYPGTLLEELEKTTKTHNQ